MERFRSSEVGDEYAVLVPHAFRDKTVTEWKTLFFTIHPYETPFDHVRVEARKVLATYEPLLATTDLFLLVQVRAELRVKREVTIL